MTSHRGREITVWVCDQCDYWRKDEASARHQTPNPEDPNGRMISHALRPAVFREAKR